MKITRIYSLFAIVGLNTLLLLAVMELGARAYIRYFAEERLAPKELLDMDKLRYSPHPYLTYYPTPGYDQGGTSHNALGYRGPETTRAKPEGVFRIVTLGGSTTYTESVDDDALTYPRVMENHLLAAGYRNVEVINGGIGGHSSFETLINFQFRVMDLDPDAVILYHAANDIHTRFVPPELHRGDNTGRRKHWSEPELETQLWQLSGLLRLYREFAYKVPPSPNSFTGTTSSWYFTDDQLAVLRQNTNQYVRRNFDNIIAVAQRHGIAIVMATFAHTPEYTEHYAVWDGYQLGFQQSNVMIMELGEQHDVPVYDFAAEMPPDRKYWNDGIHVNAEGATLKGRLFAEFLESSGLLPTVAR